MMSYCRLRLLRSLGLNYVRKLSSSYTYTTNRNVASRCAADDQKSSASSLYIKHEDMRNVEVLELDLGLEQRLKDPQSLEANIRARKLTKDIDVNQLLSDFKLYQSITREIEKAQEERQQNILTLKPLLKAKDSESEKSREFYMERGRKLKQDIKALKRNWWPVEGKVIMAALNLPVDLHTSVPMQNEIIENYGSKPEFAFPPKSHVELGKKINKLQFRPVSPTAFYLFGELAHLELNLIQEISRHLEQSGFTHFSSPDMVKTHVAEACAYDFKESHKVLTVEPKVSDVLNYKQRESDDHVTDHVSGHVGDDVMTTWHKWDILLHLFGGASLPSFAAYMTRLNFATESLPVKFFSVGRKYQPVDNKAQEPSLLNSCQGTCIEIFGGASDLEKSHDLYKTMVFITWEVAKNLQLPVRLVNVGCSHLRHPDAARTEVQVWIPSIQDYHIMSSVSMNGDFISRRLMMKNSDDVSDIHNKNYIFTVHGTILNVPIVLSALMENFQTENCTFKPPKWEDLHVNP